MYNGIIVISIVIVLFWGAIPLLCHLGDHPVNFTKNIPTISDGVFHTCWFWFGVAELIGVLLVLMYWGVCGYQQMVR